jgi:hypothetical protein
MLPYEAGILWIHSANSQQTNSDITSFHLQLFLSTAIPPPKHTHYIFLVHFLLNILKFSNTAQKILMFNTLSTSHNTQQEITHINKGKGKAIPIQAYIDPKGSRRLRLPGFSDNQHVNMVRLSVLHTGHLHPQGDPRYSFLLVTESTPGPQRGWKD